jgi:hypothetical protein
MTISLWRRIFGMPAGARYRAPAVFVTPGAALHRRLSRHEALQHSQGLAFPPPCRIRVRSKSTCGSAPHAPGVPRHSCAPRHPGQAKLAAYRGHARPVYLVVTKPGSRCPGLAYPRVATPPRMAPPPRTAPTQQARATGHGSMSGTQDHQARPGQAPRPRQLELIGIASGLVNGMVFVTMTCVRCAKDFSTTIGEICVTVARSPTRRRGGGTPDDRARQSHGSAAPASR